MSIPDDKVNTSAVCSVSFDSVELKIVKKSSDVVPKRSAVIAL